MSDEFKVKRDEAADWEASNRVLAEGEPGWDVTNGVLKIGDGVTPWNDLEGISGGGGAGLHIGTAQPTDPAAFPIWIKT